MDKYIREGRISRAEGEREIERLESSRRTLLRAHTRRQALGEVWSRLKVGTVHTARRVDRAVRHVVDDESRSKQHRQLRIELEECALAYLTTSYGRREPRICRWCRACLRRNAAPRWRFYAAANEPEKLASANVAGSVVGMDARRHARRARGHGHAKDPGDQGARVRCGGRRRVSSLRDSGDARRGRHQPRDGAQLARRSILASNDHWRLGTE